MAKLLIHPNWALVPERVTDGFSLEMTAKDIDSLRAAAPLMPVDTPVAVTFLPGEEPVARVAATKAVRELGFEPMPHFSARRITSQDEFEDYLQAVVREAGVKRCFIIAGDPPEPQGPFFDTSAMIATGAFERAGIKAIGVGGHPEGHPNMSIDESWRVLEAKVEEVERRGMAALIVTQFSFDPDAVLAWLKELLRFAARCGVGASASVMKKYGVSIANLIGNAGPDKLVDTFAAKLGEEHGPVRLHFYPFGGLLRTVEWIASYAKA